MDDFMNDDEDVLSRFEKGKPADPTKNMSPEDAETWEEMNDKYEDKFTKGAALRDEVIKLAHAKPELRNYLLPLVVTAADTFKCPTCDTKVLEQTSFCVKCKKKVKKAATDSPLDHYIPYKDILSAYRALPEHLQTPFLALHMRLSGDLALDADHKEAISRMQFIVKGHRSLKPELIANNLSKAFNRLGMKSTF